MLKRRPKFISVFAITLFISVFGIFSFYSNKYIKEGEAATNHRPVPSNVKLCHKSPSASSFTCNTSSNLTITVPRGTKTWNVRFVTKVTDADGHKTASQVMYHTKGAARWYSFGTKSAEDPEGDHPLECSNCASIPNNILTGYNYWGWNPMTLTSGGFPTGTQGSLLTSAIVTLNVGQTYEWRAKGMDNFSQYYSSNYSTGWSSPFYFTLKEEAAAPTVTPTPSPTPAPVTKTPTRTPSRSTTSYTPSKTVTKSQGTVVAADTTAPTIPGNLTGSYVAKDNVVTLGWGASEDKSSVTYDVERQIEGDPNWEKVTETDKTWYEDFQFEEQKKYTYRVRAKDNSGNLSAFSNAVTVLIGKFEPNYKLGEETTVTSDDGFVSVDLPANAAGEDLFILIEKSDQNGFDLGRDMLLGQAYQIKAKNSKGEEVKKFKTQIKISLDYSLLTEKRIDKKKLKIFSVDDEGRVELRPSSVDAEMETISTLTDHLSLYLIGGQKTGAWLTVAKVIFWLLLIAGLGYGGYWGFNYLKRNKYQKEHQDDFIYRH